ncbi:helix-turn-helix domain-containing protein [Candidatus Wolbachia massiliensis]|uniref:XRE family transcriptional regulator n=1 Tax=Candidatus Wolbachia massiliensis TaxID=1845000 RepID=A0A7L7YRK0_9RICK|nr:helix-turn-helix transcriptional regulator [Candidatus Wolbachia massiliensis]QOD37911.1 XRE family transcriptional regulator [Candidatus Wolbachia massiliensis]
MEIISLNNNSCSIEIKKKLLTIISKVIEKNTWTQAHAAERLGVDQPKISQIKNGKTDGFSLERLLGFLKKFDHEITITITKSQSVKPEVEKVKHEVGSQ